MLSLKKVAVLSAFLLFAGMVPMVAKADQDSWTTRVKINEPVVIGHMLLKPGEYIFRRVDTWAPDTVEIFSLNSNKYDGMVIGEPATRNTVSEKSVLTFKEGKTGTPDSIQYWFYPNNPQGIEFPSLHASSHANKPLHVAG